MYQIPELIFSALEELIRKQPIDGNLGGIRVQKVRKVFGLERSYKFITLEDKIITKSKLKLVKPVLLQQLQEISEICNTWVNENEVMPFKKVYMDQQIFYVPELNTTADIYSRYLSMHHIPHSRHKDFVFIDAERWEWDYKICCKRGNPIYVKMVKEKFKPLIDWSKTEAAEKKIGFSTRLNKNRKRVRKGKIFFITLTMDPDKVKTPGESWLRSGKYLNSYLTYLRQEFPGIKFFTAPQAQKNGYYHPHIIAYVPEQAFTVFPNKEFNKRKNKWEYVWRIHNRVKHNDKFVRDIFKSWKYGWSDVRAIDSLKDGLTEVLKYVTRDLTGGEYKLTLGCLWFFGKQGYSMSRKFIESLTGKTNIDLAEPGNDDLIRAEGDIQSNDTKLNLVRLEFFPPVLQKNLDYSFQKKIDDIENVPDPPPNVVRFFDNLSDKCVPVKSRKNDLGVEIVIYDYDRNGGRF